MTVHFLLFTNYAQTAPTGAHRTHTFYPRRSQPARSDVQITLCYTGRGLNLESSMDPGSSEVLILQQHCGGNTVQLYKGRVRPRGTHVHRLTHISTSKYSVNRGWYLCYSGVKGCINFFEFRLSILCNLCFSLWISLIFSYFVLSSSSQCTKYFL